MAIPGKGGLVYRSGAALFSVSAAVLACPLLPELPPPWVLALSLAAGGVLLPFRSLRLPGLFLLTGACCLFAYQSRLEDRLDVTLAGSVHDVSGVVTSVPEVRGDSIRFRFKPSAPAGAAIPDTILATWYRDWPDVRIGQTWRLELRLKPPWGTLNFTGPDRERWLFANGVGAYGSIRSGELLHVQGKETYPIQEIRSDLQKSVSRQLPAGRERAVVQALATADRAGISGRDNELLRITGTSHLLAISGLHIGLAAMGGILAARCVAWLIPFRLPNRWLFYLLYAGGAVTAVAYALLANLGVSTLRAVAMLLAAYTAFSLSRSVAPFRVYTVALAGVLLVTPFAPLGAGFWFSFLAVFALLFTFQPRREQRSWWKAALAAQSAVFLLLLPVNAAWYGGISLTAFPANLLAIPWVSVTVVPPVLAGVAVSPVSENAAGLLWSLAGLSVSGLFRYLEWLGTMQPWLLGIRTAGLMLYAAAFIGAFLLLLPRGITARWLGLFLIAPLFLPAGKPAPEGVIRLDALDVGQGTAVAVSTRNETLLYDTGPGDGAGADHVSTAIVPLLYSIGRAAPGRVVLSHGDLDHTGGLYSVRNRFPDAVITGSVPGPRDTAEPCRAGQRWLQDGFELNVLHPSGALPYQRNNSSCVLAFGDSQTGILLPGDIEDFVENRLLMEGLASYPVVMAPHHGSASSSGAAFVSRVAPAAVIASAGLGNRFGFPRPEVRARYTASGADFWSTGECGGLLLFIGEEGKITASSARRERHRIWRWPAAPGCP